MPSTTRDKEGASEVYALLHRAVEDGEATDATWQRLIETCVELDKRGEAVDAFAKIANPALRRVIRRDLARRGWVDQQNDPDEVKSRLVTDADLEPSAREKLEDAVQFLLEGRMRVDVLAGTLAFPLVLGAGAMLTAGTDSFFLRLAAMVPALFLVGMIGALAKNVLLLACRGVDDAAGLPPYAQLAREVPAFLRDFGVLAAVFLGPSALLVLLGMPVVGALLLIPAVLAMPLVVALRLAGVAWRQLQPRQLVAAARATGAVQLETAFVIALLLAPALGSFFLTLHMPLFLTISVLGPLAVAPCLIAARMLGLTLHYERERLGSLFPLPAPRRPEAPPRRTPATPAPGAASETQPDAEA